MAKASTEQPRERGHVRRYLPDDEPDEQPIATVEAEPDEPAPPTAPEPIVAEGMIRFPASQRGSSAFQMPRPVVEGVNVDVLCPFYHLVPKDPIENIEWRMFVVERCTQDPDFLAAVQAACAVDILFFLNTFGFTLDPRRDDCKKIPVITWPEQDQALLAIQQAIGEHSLWIEKTRDQSVTWDVVWVMGHDFLFHDDVHYKVASFKGEKVDDSGSPDTIFSKFDTFFQMLPEFLKPPCTRTFMLWHNDGLGGSISGEANNGNLGRSGRQKAIFLDEAPATPNMDAIIGSVSSVTNSCIFVGTHQGTSTAFARNIVKPGKAVLRIHWTQRPAHRRGLYTFDSAGNPIIFDRENQHFPVKIEKERYTFPDNYPFAYIRERLQGAGMKWEGRMLSPWYDNSCHLLGYNKVTIGSELDVDAQGSVANWFDELVIERCERDFVRPPLHIGEIDFDDRTGDCKGFFASASGRLKLYQPLNERGRLDENHEYAVACDISAGTGASPSVATFGDLTTGDLIGIWACANTSPELFAAQVRAFTLWMAHGKTPAFCIWECNGPVGKTFTKRFIELGATNVYMGDSTSGVTGETGKVPGWISTSNGVSKAMVFTNLREAFRRSEFPVPAAEVYRECREYQVAPGNIPHHPGSVTDDPTGSRDAHGDRVVSVALLWHVTRQRQMEGIAKVPEPKPPPDSLAARMKEALAHERVEAAGMLSCEWEPDTLASSWFQGVTC